MRLVHFDCFSGISGDMTLAALIDAGADQQAVERGLASLQLPITFTVEKIRRGGLAARQVFIGCEPEDDHRFLPDIEAIINRGALTEGQRDLALRIFRKLGEAEAASHGIPLNKVHFHEVGALDSIADIVGSAIAIDSLRADRFTSRSVPTGVGTLKCAHGIMPIPAPATANLLKGVPLAPSTIKAELTTPTGAAILTTIVNEWVESPVMVIESIGLGAGRRDFIEQANVLRVFVGNVAETPAPGESDTVWLLETNLDDVSGEMLGYTTEQLFVAGALDVWTQAIHMKKQRPGVLLSVLVERDRIAAVEHVLFAETGTFGVRRTSVQRSKLKRESTTVRTPWGEVKCKRGSRDDHTIVTPEYEDCVRVARQHNVPLRLVYDAVRRNS